MELAIVLAGDIAAGKSFSARYLDGRYQVNTLSFVDTLWVPILEQRGLPVTRENLQSLGIELMQACGPRGLVNDLMAAHPEVTSAVIDDVRAVDVYQYLSTRCKRTVLVYLRSSFGIRYARATVRDGVQSHEAQLAAEAVSTEAGIPGLLEIADFVVVNEGSEAHLEAELERIARALQLELR